jgi:intracellular multiplication protein IcmV
MIKFLGKVFRFKDWADWRRNKSYSLYLKDLAYHFLRLDQFKADQARNFDAMVKRYKLTDEQLSKQAKALIILSFFFLICSVLLWGYIFFHISRGNYPICLVIFCFSLIPLAMAFRYHFYYTLIKNKRLDYTIKDWMKFNPPKD